MALILKNGKKFFDKYGKERSTAYLVIDNVLIDKAKNTASVVYKIYDSQPARKGQLGSVDTYKEEAKLISGDLYNTYFSPTVLETTSVWTACYNALLAHYTPTYKLIPGQDNEINQIEDTAKRTYPFADWTSD